MSEFLKPFVGFDQMPFYITLVGVTYPTPTYHITRTCSDVWVLEYVTDGVGYVEVDGQRHRVCRDMVYFLPYGERHNYYSDSKTPFTKIFLNVSGDFCKHLVLAYGLAGKYFFAQNDLKPLFERIVDILRSDMADDEMQTALQGLFVEILSRLSCALAHREHSDEAHQLKNYLDAHYHRIVSAKELAKTIFRSPDYCQKLFLREFGMTPYAYQLEQKMQTARFLLADTSLSIGEIAEKVGYSDSHYFSNLFQRKCGVRPSSYRKSKKTGTP